MIAGGPGPNLDTVVLRFAPDGWPDDQRGGADDRLVAADASLRRADRAGDAGPLGLRLPPLRTAELQRLRTLKELLQRFDVGLSDVAFASRMNTDAELRDAVQSWLETEAQRPDNVEADDWLSFEQDKHQKLLAVA